MTYNVKNRAIYSKLILAIFYKIYIKIYNFFLTFLTSLQSKHQIKSSSSRLNSTYIKRIIIKPFLNMRAFKFLKKKIKIIRDYFL